MNFVVKCGKIVNVNLKRNVVEWSRKLQIFIDRNVIWKKYLSLFRMLIKEKQKIFEEYIMNMKQNQINLREIYGKRVDSR